MALFVSIGRNIGDTPMDTPEWLGFQGEIYENLESTVGAPDVSLVGNGGSWNDVPEETAVFIVFNPELDEPWVQLLKDYLSSTASFYHQECIALTIGDTAFVEAG